MGDNSTSFIDEDKILVGTLQTWCRRKGQHYFKDTGIPTIEGSAKREKCAIDRGRKREEIEKTMCEVRDETRRETGERDEKRNEARARREQTDPALWRDAGAYRAVSVEQCEFLCEQKA